MEEHFQGWISHRHCDTIVAIRISSPENKVRIIISPGLKQAKSINKISVLDLGVADCDTNVCCKETTTNHNNIQHTSTTLSQKHQPL